ncbi:MAG: Hsp20/alpha crystallin family protein [Candidatus Aenigmarchaeota archaeon]|nr:Hsp20/alpha crystallin family protein [Candidatus Aenigmarchaeota archaeon]
MSKKNVRDFKYFWEEGQKTAADKIEKAQKIAKHFLEEPFEFIAIRQAFPVNISETNDDVIVEGHLPGFKKGEIKVEVTEDAVHISAHKKRASAQKGRGYYIQEAGSASVSRSFTLPANVDTKKVEAKLEDGILHIKMAKLHPGKKKRRIDIREEE